MDFAVDSSSLGARVTGGEVHRGEGPVVDSRGETVAVEPWRCPAFLCWFVS